MLISNCNICGDIYPRPFSGCGVNLMPYKCAVKKQKYAKYSSFLQLLYLNSTSAPRRKKEAFEVSGNLC